LLSHPEAVKFAQELCGVQELDLKQWACVYICGGHPRSLWAALDLLSGTGRVPSGKEITKHTQLDNVASTSIDYVFQQSFQPMSLADVLDDSRLCSLLQEGHLLFDNSGFVGDSGKKGWISLPPVQIAANSTRPHMQGMWKYEEVDPRKQLEMTQYHFSCVLASLKLPVIPPSMEVYVPADFPKTQDWSTLRYAFDPTQAPYHEDVIKAMKKTAGKDNWEVAWKPPANCLPYICHPNTSHPAIEV
jgi:hypothetical protein